MMRWVILLSVGLLGMSLDVVTQDHIKAVIQIEGQLVVDLGVHQALVQLGGDLIGLLAEGRGHATDLIPIEVDRGHLLGIAAIGDLVPFSVEPEPAATAREDSLGGFVGGHAAEGVGQVLPDPVESVRMSSA